jgi:hypothetical protein
MDRVIALLGIAAAAVPIMVAIYVIVQHLFAHGRGHSQNEPFEIRGPRAERRFVQRSDGNPQALISVAERTTGLTDARYKRGFGIGPEATAIILAAFVLELATGVVANTLSDNSNSLPAALVSILAVIIPLFCGLAAWRAAKEHRRAMQKRADLLAGDFVLYFRPFTFDFATSVHAHDLSTDAGGGYEINITFEESLSATYLQWSIGVQAIGRKYRGIFGPKSIETSNETWMQDAERLMRLARLIVIVPASSKGSFWELKQVSNDRELLTKTAWIMPPKRMARKFRPDDDWTPAALRCSAELDLPFPQYHKDGAIFCFDRQNDSEIAITLRPYSKNLLARVLATVRPGRVSELESSPILLSVEPSPAPLPPADRG